MGRLNLDDRVVDTTGTLPGTTPFTALRVTGHHKNGHVDVTTEEPAPGEPAIAWRNVKPSLLTKVG